MENKHLDTRLAPNLHASISPYLQVSSRLVSLNRIHSLRSIERRLDSIAARLRVSE